jgi:hypothetical protein
MISIARAPGRDLDTGIVPIGQAEQGVRPSDPGECITVALIPAAAGGLRRLLERTNLSMTDIANRAITSYEFFDAHLKAGRELVVRDTRSGETQLIRFS